MSKDINLAIEFQLDLSRASANIVGKMLKTLRQLELDLIGITAATEWKKNRIEKQLKETRILIQKYYEYASKQVSGVPALQIATASASAAVVGLGSAALMPSTEFLKAVSDDAIVQGAPLKAWWAKQSDDLTFKYTAAVRQGVVASETNQQIIRRVKDVMLTQSHHVAALVQTSTASISNAAREEVFQKNQDIIKVRRALATLDSSTCLQCAPLDGLEWETDGTPIDHSFPMPAYPLHVNCLTGDALISSINDVTGYSKRWFDGEIVVIQTAAGRELTSTPNHPILTRSGWIAAGSLDIGGYVVCDAFSHRRTGIHSDHENMPARIHDVVESLLCSGKMMPVPVPMTASDFHGDGVGSNVAIVYSKSLLRCNRDSARIEHISKHNFINTFLNVASLFTSFGGKLKPFDFSWSASDSVMRGLSKLFPLFGAGRCHSCGLLLAPVSGFDSGVTKGANHYHSAYSHFHSNSSNPNPGIVQRQSLRHIDRDFTPAGIDADRTQDFDNNVKTDAMLASNLLAGSAGPVTMDKIISVKRGLYSGHVYNLETDKGWYVANGIITHNCRCLLLNRITRDPPGGKRAAEHGPISAKTTFTDWLDGLSKEKQAEILGPGRADLFRKGKITLADLTNGNGRPLTLKQLAQKYK